MSNGSFWDLCAKNTDFPKLVNNKGCTTLIRVHLILGLYMMMSQKHFGFVRLEILGQGQGYQWVGTILYHHILWCAWIVWISHLYRLLKHDLRLIVWLRQVWTVRPKLASSHSLQFHIVWSGAWTPILNKHLNREPLHHFKMNQVLLRTPTSKLPSILLMEITNL